MENTCPKYGDMACFCPGSNEPSGFITPVSWLFIWIINNIHCQLCLCMHVGLFLFCLRSLPFLICNSFGLENPDLQRVVCSTHIFLIWLDRFAQTITNYKYVTTVEIVYCIVSASFLKDIVFLNTTYSI